MQVGASITKAISDRLGGDLEPSMLHACNAVDGTAKKMYPALGVGARFRKLLRENYTGILEPMVPGVNMEKTVFPISISGATGWTTAGGVARPNSRPSRRWTGTGSASPSTSAT